MHNINSIGSDIVLKYSQVRRSIGVCVFRGVYMLKYVMGGIL